jgi:D-alanyl-D-alanine carboxypeptidase
MRRSVFFILMIVFSVLWTQCTETDRDFEQHEQIQNNLRQLVDSMYSDYVQEVPGFVLYDDVVYDVTHTNASPYVAEGNLITTPDDLSWFLSRLLSGEGVLSFYTVNTLMMQCLPSGGLGTGSYGCGLSYTNNLGFGHTGAIEGYLSKMVYDPDLNFTFVAYTNAWNLNGGIESLEKQMIQVLEEIAFRSRKIVREATR